MTARSRMVLRAVVERNVAVGEDEYGQDVLPDYQPHGTFPCWFYGGPYAPKRELVDGRKTVVVEDLRVMFPLGTDIRRGDQIVRITDRAGNVQLNEPIRVSTAPRYARTHLMVPVEKIE